MRERERERERDVHRNNSVFPLINTHFFKREITTCDLSRNPCSVEWVRNDLSYFDNDKSSICLYVEYNDLDKYVYTYKYLTIFSLTFEFPRRYKVTYVHPCCRKKNLSNMILNFCISCFRFINILI